MFLQAPEYAEAWDQLPSKIRLLLNEDMVPLHRVHHILARVEVDGEEAVYELLKDTQTARQQSDQRWYEAEIVKEMMRD